MVNTYTINNDDFQLGSTLEFHNIDSSSRTVNFSNNFGRLIRLADDLQPDEINGVTYLAVPNNYYLKIILSNIQPISSKGTYYFWEVLVFQSSDISGEITTINNEITTINNEIDNNIKPINGTIPINWNDTASPRTYDNLCRTVKGNSNTIRYTKSNDRIFLKGSLQFSINDGFAGLGQPRITIDDPGGWGNGLLIATLDTTSLLPKDDIYVYVSLHYSNAGGRKYNQTSTTRQYDDFYPINAQARITKSGNIYIAAMIGRRLYPKQGDIDGDVACVNNIVPNNSDGGDTVNFFLEGISWDVS